MPANVLIGIDTAQLTRLMKNLEDMPKAIQDAAIDEATPYIVDVLKTYPPKNYITRKAAYGKSFFTEKQRRWFFAALNSGAIDVPYKRTQGLRKAWQVIDRGKSTIIVNDSPGAPFVMGTDTQSRHERMVGWETIAHILARRATRIGEKLQAGAKKAMKKMGFRDV